MLTALRDGRLLSRIERMREDPTIPELLGMEAVVGDDTVRRFFQSVDPVLGAEWIARHAKPRWGAVPETIARDWDSTGQSRCGHQEGAEVGHNPRKPNPPTIAAAARNFSPPQAARVAAGQGATLSMGGVGM